MEKINFEFALDVQEESQKQDFTEALKTVLKKWIFFINREKSTGNLITFKDESKCEFIGHNIKLID